MAQVNFTSRSYFNASQEHLSMAAQMLLDGQYFAAHYFAGIAVESILRANSVTQAGTFSSNHSIEYWAEQSGILSRLTIEQEDRMRNVLDEINRRWRANQRYMTSKMLDTSLESLGLDRIRGDRVKYSSKRLFDLATVIVTSGVEKWNSNNKS